MTFRYYRRYVGEIREGRMIIIVDDEDRENEGDLVCAAEKVTPKSSTSWPACARLDLFAAY